MLFGPHGSIDNPVVRLRNRVSDGVRVRGAVPARTGSSFLQKRRSRGVWHANAVQKARDSPTYYTSDGEGSPSALRFFFSSKPGAKLRNFMLPRSNGIPWSGIQRWMFFAITE